MRGWRNCSLRWGKRHSGTRRRRGPGIQSHTQCPRLWIPGSLATLAPRNDEGARHRPYSLRRRVRRNPSRLSPGTFLAPACARGRSAERRILLVSAPCGAGARGDGRAPLGAPSRRFPYDAGPRFLPGIPVPDSEPAPGRDPYPRHVILFTGLPDTGFLSSPA
jgi:hypothetical protein